MTLQEYYKKHIFEYGFNVAFNNRQSEISELVAKKKHELDGTYFNEEMDYYICADYFGEYVGEDKNWTQEDLDFLEVLGFASGDFLDYTREGRKGE